MNQEKRPRHWAAEIAKLPTREERLARLNQAPEEWRDLIKRHVENAFALKKMTDNNNDHSN